MHQYDYRCDCCRLRFTLRYKTYGEYDRAVPRCPDCGSTELSRLISKVAIPKTSRDYGSMSSGEMLSVLESGDSRQARDMFEQVEGSARPSGAPARGNPLKS